MADNEDHSLIPLPDGSLANTAAGAKRVLAEMVGETLALTRQDNQPAKAKPISRLENLRRGMRNPSPKLKMLMAAFQEKSVPKDESGDKTIAVDNLKAGDVVEADGQPLKVLHIDEDGTVTLEDHTRYAVQSVEAGHVIYGELEPLPSNPKISTLRGLLLRKYAEGKLTTKGKIVLGKLNRAAKVSEGPKDAKR